MSISYPSRPVMVVDTPEVKNFNGSFVYNFFVPDERIKEDASNIPKSLIKKGPTFFDNFTEDQLNRIPRFAKLDWSQVKIDEPSQVNLQPGSRVVSPVKLSKENSNFIERNIGKIYREEEFTNRGFTGVELQDTGLDNKLNLLVSGTVAKYVNSSNIDLARTVNEQLELVSNKIDTNRVSLLDVAKFLSREIGAEDLPSQTIIDSLTDLRTSEARFYTQDDQLEITENTFETLKKVKTRYRINNKLIGTYLSSIASDPLGFFADEVGPLLEGSEQIQREIVQDLDPETIDEAEFDIIVEPVSLRKAPLGTGFLPTKKHIGYIIDRFRRLDNGTLSQIDPIYIEKETTTSTIDFNIAYGVVYVYQIRAIYLLEFQTFSENNDEIALSTILVSSAPSERLVLPAVENVPPPVPADINVFWDHQEQAPCISWCFPVNRQRDIKRWQVFKRTTVDEPFELLVELDFDNSAVKTVNFETVNINLRKLISNPQQYWIDKDFEKDNVAIYTVCSVDAHGLSSNYGIQLEVKFNRFKNNITKKLISSSGAPKPYPNMFLNEDTFVDTMKDSNHTRMKIYFDPEYLEVVRAGGLSDPFIGTDKNNTSYKMQLINVDFQQSQLIDINVKDLRSVKESGRSNSSTIVRKNSYKKLNIGNLSK